MTNDICDCAAFKVYKIGKAAMYLRKAKSILEEMELDNFKVQSDFRAILMFCSEMTFNQRKLIRKMEGKYENNIENYNQG